MQKDFIFTYFSDMNRIIMELTKYISEDNVLYVESHFNQIESLTRKFRKRWQEEITNMIKGKNDEKIQKKRKGNKNLQK